MKRFSKKQSDQNIMRWLTIGLTGITSVLIVTILGTAILTIFFNVPMGDDYLAIETFSNKNTWLAETIHTLMNTSRYAQGLAGSLSYGLFRETIVYILPFVVIVWTYVLLFVYQKLIYTKLNFANSTSSIALISAGLLALLLSAGRSVDTNHVWLFYQSFYFSSAIVTYTLAALFYATLFYVFMRFPTLFSTKPRIKIAVFALLCFLLGLFNETAPATLFGLGIIGVLLSFTKVPFLGGLKTIRSYLYTATGTSLLALFSMYFTPANTGRRDATGATYSSSLIGPILENIHEVMTTMTNRPSDIILIIGIGLLTYLFIKPKKDPFKTYSALSMYGALFVIAGILALTAALTLLTVGYGAYTSIYPRALLLMQLLYIPGGVLLSFGAIGLMLHMIPIRLKFPVATIVTMIVLIATLAVAPHTISKSAHHMAGVQDYQATWLKQDATLRQASRDNPNATIYLQATGAGIGDGYSTRCNGPFSSSTRWLNNGMEEYYGLREICAIDDQKIPRVTNE